MSIITDLLKNPLTALVDGVKEVIVGKLTNDADKIAATTKLTELQVGLQEAVLNADLEFAKSQQAVIVAEAQSESWLTKSWRPLTMLFFVGLVGAYWFGWTAPNLPEPTVMELLGIVKIGLGGYVIGRSVEKTLPNMVTAFKGGGGE